MVNSSYAWTPELRAQAAVGHDWYNRRLPEYPHSTQAQGGLVTTSSDLALFMAASMPGPNGEPVGRGVLTPESVAETFTPVPFTNDAESSHITGLGYDLMMVDGTLLGARKTGDHRGYKPIIVMAPEQGEGIAIMTNGDRAITGFTIDIACAWSENVDGHPMQEGCRELGMIRNVQFAVAGVLALGVLVYVSRIVAGIRAGRRRLGWNFAWGKVVRIALPAVLLVVWWIFWHTDTLFQHILGRLPDTYVTIRLLVPWPTVFVRISWAVTLWMMAWMAVVFAPKVKKSQ
jgi:hypothetical protein